MVTIKQKITKFSKKGYEVAFANRSNAAAYIKALKEQGYKRPGILRSSGPTVDVKKGDSKRTTKAYYVLPGSKTKTVRRTFKKKEQGIFTGGGLYFGN